MLYFVRSPETRSPSLAARPLASAPPPALRTSNKIKHIHQVYIYNSPFYLGENFKNNRARKSQLLQVLDYVSQSINTVSVIATSKTSYVRRNTGDDPSVGHPSLPPPPLDNPKIDNSHVPG